MLLASCETIAERGCCSEWLLSYVAFPACRHSPGDVRACAAQVVPLTTSRCVELKPEETTTAAAAVSSHPLFVDWLAATICSSEHSYPSSPLAVSNLCSLRGLVSALVQ